MTAPSMVEVLAEHVRGDWSDRTYSCQGCEERELAGLEAEWSSLARVPTVEGQADIRSRIAKASHPKWSMDDYHAHVAAALTAAGFGHVASVEAERDGARSEAEHFRERLLVRYCLARTEPDADERIEQACRVMHDAYERAAVGAGWETQERSRKPWTDVPEANKATMRGAVAALLDHLAEAQVAAVRALGDEAAYAGRHINGYSYVLVSELRAALGEAGR